MDEQYQTGRDDAINHLASSLASMHTSPLEPHPELVDRRLDQSLWSSAGAIGSGMGDGGSVIKVSPPADPRAYQTPRQLPSLTLSWCAPVSSLEASDGARSRSASSSQSSQRADSHGSSALWDDATDATTASSATSPDSESAIGTSFSGGPPLAPAGCSANDDVWGLAAEALRRPSSGPRRATSPDSRNTPPATSTSSSFNLPCARASTYPLSGVDVGRQHEFREGWAASPASSSYAGKGSSSPSRSQLMNPWAASARSSLPAPPPAQPQDADDHLFKTRRQLSGVLKRAAHRHHHESGANERLPLSNPRILDRLEDFGVRVIGSGKPSDPPLGRVGPEVDKSRGRRPEEPPSHSLVSPTAGRNLTAHLIAPADDTSDATTATFSETRQPKGSGVRGISAAQLGNMMAERRPGTQGKLPEQDEPTDPRPLLLIDARKLDEYLGPAGRLSGSINVNFPSLLIKRFRRKTSLAHFSLDAFVTTETGKQQFRAVSGSSSADGALGSLDICVIDEALSEEAVKDTASGGTGVVLLGVLDVLSREASWHGRIYFLDGRFEDLAQSSQSSRWLTCGEAANEMSREIDLDVPRLLPPKLVTPGPQFATIVHGSPVSEDDAPRRRQGLLRLRPSGTLRDLPRLDVDGALRSPAPLLRNNSGASDGSVVSAASSPAILEGGEGTPHSASKTKHKLRRIDTSDSLLGLARPLSKRAPTPLSGIGHSTNFSVQVEASTPISSQPTLQEMCRTQARARVSPGGSSDLRPLTPGNGYDDAAPSPMSLSPSPGAQAQFIVSTVIPGFLYLGGEPKKEADYEELELLGVERVLNVAAECVEEEAECRRRFKSWDSISLLDFVEESGVQSAIDRCNTLLDDASLHSAPTFLHCVAGKSRSVTIAIAYLIHRHGWDLQRAYGHVSECRRGVSPNIGFVSELMIFSERNAATRKVNARRDDYVEGPRPSYRLLPDSGRTQSLGSLNAVLMSAVKSHHRRDSTPVTRASTPLSSDSGRRRSAEATPTR